ncbi:Hypothetical predicted protein, partial [Paramuricea clavata]
MREARNGAYQQVHSSTLKKLDDMGKEFDKPVLEWKEKIESHGSLCDILSKCEEYIEENEVINQEFVPKGFQTINVSPHNLSFPFTKTEPQLVQVDHEACNKDHNENSLSSESECELFYLENLPIEADTLPLIRQSESLNLITLSGETHKQNFKKWLDENAPGFSILSFIKLANLAKEIGKDGLDGSDVSTLRRKLELDTPPLYQIVGDNTDLYVKTKHMSSEKQNKIIHWFAMNAVQDRVTGNALDNLRPIKSIMKMESKEFLPSFHDNQHLLHDFIPLFARVLVDKIPAMQNFKSVVVKHIPHKYSNEMKKKTTQ